MPVSSETVRTYLDAERRLDALDHRFDALGERYSGKVRENFTRDGVRTIVVTDRVSAFDRVLGTIPMKGQVLNQLAAYWFEQTKDTFANHMIDTPDPQVMRAHECTPIPVEMVVRGYLTGVSSTSIWTAYESGRREFCGHRLAEGLTKHQKLPTNIVTPTTKAAKGEHDVNASPQELIDQGLVTREVYDELEARALALFARGQEMAAQRGLILVDSKYELGRKADGEIVLIDEIHTPDSSRYWYSESYDGAMSKGEDPKSLDKEFLRRWLAAQGYKGEGTPPPLSDEILIEAAQRYVETYEVLTGQAFVPAAPPAQERIASALLGG